MATYWGIQSGHTKICINPATGLGQDTTCCAVEEPISPFIDVDFSTYTPVGMVITSSNLAMDCWAVYINGWVGNYCTRPIKAGHSPGTNTMFPCVFDNSNGYLQLVMPGQGIDTHKNMLEARYHSNPSTNILRFYLTKYSHSDYYGGAVSTYELSPTNKLLRLSGGYHILWGGVTPYVAYAVQPAILRSSSAFIGSKFIISNPYEIYTLDGIDDLWGKNMIISPPDGVPHKNPGWKADNWSMGITASKWTGMGSVYIGTNVLYPSLGDSVHRYSNLNYYCWIEKGLYNSSWLKINQRQGLQTKTNWDYMDACAYTKQILGYPVPIDPPPLNWELVLA